MGVELATAYISILPSTKGLGRALNAQMVAPVGAASKAAGASMSAGIGGAMASMGGAFVGMAVIKGLQEATTAASDLAETTSKARVVFGQASAGVETFASKAASALGMSNRVALESAGTFGNLFVSMGLAQGKSADMSTTIVQLAADLASFNNTRPEDALEALRAGLVGETEPLRRYGININDAELRQEAMALGLTTTTTEVLPAAIRAQASYALMLKQTATAQGDFARTSDGMANSTRIAAAELEDAKAKLGKAGTPIATWGMQEAAKGLTDANSAMDSLSAGVVKTSFEVAMLDLAFNRGLITQEEYNQRVKVLVGNAADAAAAERTLAGASSTVADATNAAATAAGGAAVEFTLLKAAMSNSRTTAEGYTDAVLAEQSAEATLKATRKDKHATAAQLLSDEQKLGDAHKQVGVSLKQLAGEYGKLTPKQITAAVKSHELTREQGALFTAAHNAGREVGVLKGKLAELPSGKKIDVKVNFSGGARVTTTGQIVSGSQRWTVRNLAYGGIFPATSGGVLSRLAEAGVPEAAIPVENTPNSWRLLAETARRMSSASGGRPLAPAAAGGNTVQILGDFWDESRVEMVAARGMRAALSSAPHL